MARDCGLDIYGWGWPHDKFIGRLEAFEALVRADERTRLHPKKIKAAKDEYCHGDERYYVND